MDVVDLAEGAMLGRTSGQDGAATDAHALVPLTCLPPAAWQALCARAIEPNGYYLPGWELAVNASASGRTDALALAARRETKLIGLLPVVQLRRAWKIPLPALVSAHPYGTLCTPPLDRDMADEAAAQLLQNARASGARALILRDMSLAGAAMQAIGAQLARDGLRPRVLQSWLRACLDATRDAEALLQDALGAKKLKELRRQRRRLGEHGTVTFDVARSSDDVAAALDVFLALETSGWKGTRGTALAQDQGDATFIRRATRALAETGQCEIVTLRTGETPVASGIVLRQQSRAFFFKIGVDERFAKYSPGVQLTLDLTRHLCADSAIASADSTASADHPMINPIWRGRFAVGDLLIPLRRNDPVVGLIHGALLARRHGLDLARSGARLIRSWRDRRPHDAAH